LVENAVGGERVDDAIVVDDDEDDDDGVELLATKEVEAQRSHGDHDQQPTEGEDVVMLD
jgi:hypothetical protein